MADEPTMRNVIRKYIKLVRLRWATTGNPYIAIIGRHPKRLWRS